YDTRGLFRWLSKYCAERPDLADRIAAEPPLQVVPGGKKSFAEAFVLETLRMDQSERLIRKTSRDIVFDGYLIPKDSVIRICLWESHRSPEYFADPFRFDPDRFLRTEFTADQFAPFGLDQHQCPFGGMVMHTALTFVRALAEGYRVAALNDGEPIRGPYVWEPAKEFSVRLHPRE
ncbi:MAG: cytochrome P450, partial [Gemmatimonadota bacterium]